MSGEDSSGERVQAWLPEAHVVKCFNTVGAPLMVDPAVLGGPPTMFLCGEDDDAKTQAATILDDFGWESLGRVDTYSDRRSRPRSRPCRVALGGRSSGIALLARLAGAES